MMPGNGGQMKLTDREKFLFTILKNRKEISLDELEQRIDADRKAICVRLKYLAAKVAGDGYVIERTSPIGRGHRAVYSMSKIT